ncbi:MAG TPA: hypothetical protein VL175_05610 [Pirellulales bacterium]|nr:hypothetical protein [Pirellulales bacterium]
MKARYAAPLAALVFLGAVVHGSFALAVDTTYGEDPVPDAHRVRGSVSMGYGVDPVPLESPLSRLRKWRARFGSRPTGAPENQPPCPPMAERKIVAGPTSASAPAPRLVRLPPIR